MTSPDVEESREDVEEAAYREGQESAARALNRCLELCWDKLPARAFPHSIRLRRMSGALTAEVHMSCGCVVEASSLLGGPVVVTVSEAECAVHP